MRRDNREWDRNDIFSKFISSSHPTYIVCRNWESNFSLLGPTPQLALPVEFLFEILYVGPLTRIEKSLLQAHFRSVNYCQYNFVEH
ncbi:hypothetical protein SA0515718_00856 [Staphylococcus aureus]|nr:hypothetical protein SAU400_03375 [Staphylococcus aureus]QLH60072.1 hypothetical protein SA0515718_00856 [Staphylococcus aureus]QLI00352.1 hypothetical protein SA950122_00846 [Staphylococcus aureus]